MPTLRAVLAAAEALWPADGAESWDAVGLVSGDPDAEVRHVHLTVDAVPEVAREAVALGADLLVAHHPLLLRGVTTIAETTYKGSVLATLVRGGCALLAAHTNADVVTTGTSAVLADRLGLVKQRPIEPGARPGTGIGRVGVLAAPMTLGALARHLVDVLPATASGVRVSGEHDRPVRTVALCAGAGDSLLGAPEVLAADVYVTSDLRHHPASEFRERAMLSDGPALVDTSHWATEWLWLDVAAAQLADATGVRVTVSDIRTDPWDFAVLPSSAPHADGTDEGPQPTDPEGAAA
ncbi:Nif3-like dinuclear metal center hexameric protein [Curtobacterium sp. MCBD17_003]|uniref:Nif3-like dinuclear metal center hexameric protein n=1 Tax=Curtobacterium sp. MCBD17_003 TaxID=2175667 RepID=UPI000DA98766|nr:Nif3-like dinuclear metal center hexameric protein [Curtobacterium sp. MCBD17_003]WIE55967.1 Nif3-like dinuclear metal center hexameric protein [Curtobacterium sp. MCBD17_003]